jgi:di/tricarboxylate transporter
VQFDQAITLVVLASVVAALVFDKGRADVVALAGAAVLLMTGVVRPIEVQGAFASPAIIALASLFVIAYAMELSGLLDAAIRSMTALCRRIGAAGIWLLIGICGAASSFLNNTPVVVLAAPVVRDVAQSLKLPPRRYLIPLSYAAVLGGTCTLIGTSTNLLVDDMASITGQPRFGIFEITPVGLAVAIAGGLYLMLFSGRLIGDVGTTTPETTRKAAQEIEGRGVAASQIGSAEAFAEPRPLQSGKALISAAAFLAVIVLAALDIAPIAACAFAGAVALILLRVITADQAYSGLRPDILMLIAGMIVLGIAVEQSGLASAVTERLVGSLESVHPLVALAILYGATLFATELLSNATVAVLITPLAVALAESLNVDPRPFLVAVMMGGSAAFATPFGYQTNVLVYRIGGYAFVDFVKVGLPLNIITWVVGVGAISIFFPF